MPGPPGERMTREKFIFRERKKKSPTFGHMTKLFWESEFNHKRNKQTKKRKSQKTFAVFSAATDSKIKMIEILLRKGQKKIWTELPLLEQEPTFKITIIVLLLLFLQPYLSKSYLDAGVFIYYMHVSYLCHLSDVKGKREGTESLKTLFFPILIIHMLLYWKV